MERGVKCAVCKKPFNIVVKHFCKSSSIRRTQTDSVDGVYYTEHEKKGRWFCNDCWKEIMEFYNAKRTHKTCRIYQT